MDDSGWLNALVAKVLQRIHEAAERGRRIHFLAALRSQDETERPANAVKGLPTGRSP
jgi:hypothetical protein